ncbi:MAG: hypothetical protein ACR2OX_11710 [Methyloligellaceae bacterium]
MLARLLTLFFTIAAFGAPAIAGPVSGSILGSDLRAELANGAIVKVRGCHSYPQKHYIPRLDKYARHYHSGRRCWPSIVRKRRSHCHRKFGRHYHRKTGWRWHRHAGKACYATRGRTFKRRYRPRGYRDCVRLGGVWVCK